MIRVQDSPDLKNKYLSFVRTRSLFKEEIDAWLAFADLKEQRQILGRNFSQMRRLKLFIGEMLDLALPFLNKLRLDAPQDTFLFNTEEAETRLRLAEFLWNYFRTKLATRLTPQFKDALWAADLITYNCYNTVMSKAEELGIPQTRKDVDGSPLRIRGEAPLPYLESGMQGIATLRRFDQKPFAGVMFKDGNERNRMLPIAVIEVPAILMRSMWELVVLAHEVSHDIDGDLNTLHYDLPDAVESAFKDAPDRGARWKGWALEIFADLMALRLMGPAYARYCFQLLIKESVTAESSTVYPSNYLRMLLVLYYLREQLDGRAEADEMEKNWRLLFGELPEIQAPYVKDFEIVARTMMETPFAALQDANKQNHRLAELVTFTADDKKYIETTRQILQLIVDRLFPLTDLDEDECRKRIGTEFATYKIREIQFVDRPNRAVSINEAGEPPAARHVASASYLAFEALLKTSTAAELPRRLNLLNLVAQELVKAKQPAIQLGDDNPGEAERKHMSNQARNLFEMVASSAQHGTSRE